MATILVVDDRPSNRQFLTTLLAYGGHILLEAGNGIEALYQLHEHRPDLLITDILMPTMDGYDLVQQLRADPELAGMPVIFHTASYSTAQAKALADTCGVRHVLPKPCEPEIILATVSDALGLEESPAAASTPGHESGVPGAFPDVVSPFGSYLTELENVGGTIDRLLARMGPESAAARTRPQQLPVQVVAQFARLRRISAAVSTLISVEIDLAAQRDPHEVVNRFFATACDAIDSRIAAVGLLDNDEKSLRYVLAKGVDREGLIRGAPDSAFLGSLLAGDTPRRRRAGQAVSPDEGMPAGHPPINNLLGLTIASRERVLGWLYFAQRVGTAGFTEDEERLGTVLATKLAIYYENATYYDMIQRCAARLQIDATLRQHSEPPMAEGAPTSHPADDAGEAAAGRASPARTTAGEFLTRRELDVLKLIVDGKSHAEAGLLLGLSPRSVETYRGRLMQKLGLGDLPALVKFAIRHGITPLD